MSARATAMNPAILRWARERVGLSVDELASKVSRSAEVVASWESGTSYPTFVQLETLAAAVKRPVAVFFFPEPPDEEDIRTRFRTLPDSDYEELEWDTRLALREGFSRQESLRELTGGLNPAPRLITDDLQATITDDVVQFAMQVREYLGITLEEQRSMPNVSEALKTWRDAVEDVGIFVFKRPFDQKTISGFCIDDATFPIIMINNSTAHSRQIFTLFHELGHLLYGVSAISQDTPGYIDRLSDIDRHLERACNRFAAELLLPDRIMPSGSLSVATVEAFAVDLADQYKVSREVVLRRFYDRGQVSAASYQDLVSAWYNEGNEGRKSSGGNYYYNQATYLGNAFLHLAFSQYHLGNIDLAGLSSHLGVKARGIDKLADVVFKVR